jgi:hypothetical protein
MNVPIAIAPTISMVRTFRLPPRDAIVGSVARTAPEPGALITVVPFVQLLVLSAIALYYR